MSGDDIEDYGFGYLNPVRPDTANQRTLDTSRRSPLSAIRETVRENYVPDALDGLSRFRGIVLREDTDGQPRSENVLESITNAVGLTNPIRSYRIRVPELHATLPIPTKVAESYEEQGEHQIIIDMYPLFMAKSDETPQASPGDIVWVEFLNLVEQEEGHYVGPIINGQGEAASTNTSGGQDEGTSSGAFETGTTGFGPFETPPPSGGTGGATPTSAPTSSPSPTPRITGGTRRSSVSSPVGSGNFPGAAPEQTPPPNRPAGTTLSREDYSTRSIRRSLRPVRRLREFNEEEIIFKPEIRITQPGFGVETEIWNFTGYQANPSYGGIDRRRVREMRSEDYEGPPYDPENPPIRRIGLEQRGRAVNRDPSVIHTLVLHSTGARYSAGRHQIRAAGGNPKLALARRAMVIPVHFTVFAPKPNIEDPAYGADEWAKSPEHGHPDGFGPMAIWHNELTRYLNSSNEFSATSIAMEIESFCPGHPGLIGRRYPQRTRRGPGPLFIDITPAHIKAVKNALTFFVGEARRQGMPLQYVVSHRQTHRQKPGDPGYLAWREIAIAHCVNELGLESPNSLVLDRGKPIPTSWDPENGIGDY